MDFTCHTCGKEIEDNDILLPFISGIENLKGIKFKYNADMFEEINKIAIKLSIKFNYKISIRIGYSTDDCIEIKLKIEESEMLGHILIVYKDNNISNVVYVGPIIPPTISYS